MKKLASPTGDAEAADEISEPVKSSEEPYDLLDALSDFGGACVGEVDLQQATLGNPDGSWSL